MVLLCHSWQLSPLLAQKAPLQAAQLPAAENLGINLIGCLLRRISCSQTKENCKVLLNNPRAGLLRGESPPSPICFHTPPWVQRTCWKEISPLPLLDEILTPCFSKPVPAPSAPHVWHLLQLQPDSGCAYTRAALNPSSWQCHQLQPNYTGHELDPVHTETATACS